MEAQDIYEAHRAYLRRFAEAEIKPFSAIVDEEARFPTESIAAIRKLDLPGLAFPAAFGGGDGDLMVQVLAVEEIARVCACTAHLMLTSWVAIMPLVVAGSAELKEHIVPQVAAGRAQASFCLTEPGGGSDVAGIRTVGEPTAGGWRLNGAKRFISNAGVADWYAVLARNAPVASASSWSIATIPASPLAERNEKWVCGDRRLPMCSLMIASCRRAAWWVIRPQDMQP